MEGGGKEEGFLFFGFKVAKLKVPEVGHIVDFEMWHFRVPKDTDTDTLCKNIYTHAQLIHNINLDICIDTTSAWFMTESMLTYTCSCMYLYIPLFVSLKPFSLSLSRTHTHCTHLAP